MNSMPQGASPLPLPHSSAEAPPVPHALPCAQMLDLASMTFFLIALDCQYFDVDPAVMYYNQEFPEQCGSG